MANVSGSRNSSSKFTYTPTGLPGNPPYDTPSQVAKANWTNGTAAGQVDLLHRKTYSLAAAPTALDLFGGSLLDPFGNACAFRRIRALRVRVKTTTDGQTVLMGYSTTTANAWTSLLSNPGQLTIAAAVADANGNILHDGWVEFVAPNTTGWVVATSNKLLNFDPGANTISIDVEIEGCSA
jgi:hypothetical protein